LTRNAVLISHNKQGFALTSRHFTPPNLKPTAYVTDAPGASPPYSLIKTSCAQHSHFGGNRSLFPRLFMISMATQMHTPAPAINKANSPMPKAVSTIDTNAIPARTMYISKSNISQLEWNDMHKYINNHQHNRSKYPKASLAPLLPVFLLPLGDQ
jgi:hypothetical protein